MKNKDLVLIVATISLFLLIVTSLSLGSVNVPTKILFRVLTGEDVPTYGDIILKLRLPRIIESIFVGMALSIAGAFFQGLLRNPMAEPYILGVSSGSALGATIAIVTNLGIFGVNVLSFLIGIITTFFVYLVSQSSGRVSTYLLILVGVATNSMLFSIISLLAFLNHEEFAQVFLWIMGSFTLVGWRDVIVSVPIITIGSFVMYLFSRDVNAILTGEESAEHLGIDVEKTKRILLIMGSILTASCVSVSGIIGFVGLIVPHISRIIVGPDNRILIPVSAILGANFMLLADLIARLIIKPAEMPVGIITAFFGTPFFLYLLLKTRRSEL